MGIERGPIILGEVIGHRCWEVHKLDGIPTLRSWVYNCFWLPGGIVSDMSYTTAGLCEGPIDDYNQRGVWAFKTRDKLHEDFKGYHLARGLVYGTCYMWGTIIEHELGYRSQYARVLALDTKVNGLLRGDGWSYDYTAEPCDIDLTFLRERYGVGMSEDLNGPDRADTGKSGGDQK